MPCFDRLGVVDAETSDGIVTNLWSDVKVKVIAPVPHNAYSADLDWALILHVNRRMMYNYGTGYFV
jgi:hypothetical protein